MIEDDRLRYKDGKWKLRPVEEEFKIWDGYRGNLQLAWSFIVNAKGVQVEIYGCFCPQCGTSYGWTPDLDQIEKTAAAMLKLGCGATAERRRQLRVASMERTLGIKLFIPKGSADMSRCQASSTPRHFRLGLQRKF